MNILDQKYQHVPEHKSRSGRSWSQRAAVHETHAFGENTGIAANGEDITNVFFPGGSSNVESRALHGTKRGKFNSVSQGNMQEHPERWRTCSSDVPRRLSPCMFGVTVTVGGRLGPALWVIDTLRTKASNYMEYMFHLLFIDCKLSVDE